MKTYGPLYHRVHGYEIMTPVRIMRTKKADLGTLTQQQIGYLTKVRNGYTPKGFDEAFDQCRDHLDRIFN